jgi:hypothetical protein
MEEIRLMRELLSSKYGGDKASSNIALPRNMEEIRHLCAVKTSKYGGDKA